MITANLPAQTRSELVKPRSRVIIDNDFAGDPDGLVQAAHHLLSPSTDVRFIIGSHLHAGEPWLPPGIRQAAQSAHEAEELLKFFPHERKAVRVLAGAETALASNEVKPAATTASDAIIVEAMSAGNSLPLYYCAGAGLTDLATAWLREPQIGKRMTLVWIGGPEYKDLADPPPGPTENEFNLTIDLRAAQVIFGESDIPIWQVPRSTYRKMIMSYAELLNQVRTTGALGDYLVSKIESVTVAISKMPNAPNPGETYVLGDSPLVSLTALQSSFQADPSSSRYVTRSCPTIDADGSYRERGDGRAIRIYTDIDARLTFADFCAKLKLSAKKNAYG